MMSGRTDMVTVPFAPAPCVAGTFRIVVLMTAEEPAVLPRP